MPTNALCSCLQSLKIILGSMQWWRCSFQKFLKKLFLNHFQLFSFYSYISMHSLEHTGMCSFWIALLAFFGLIEVKHHIYIPHVQLVHRTDVFHQELTPLCWPKSWLGSSWILWLHPELLPALLQTLEQPIIQWANYNNSDDYLKWFNYDYKYFLDMARKNGLPTFLENHIFSQKMGENYFGENL